ncbi:MAG: 4'-phosphopantetheinyl transferase family protein [Hydrogenophaga sp.]
MDLEVSSSEEEFASLDVLSHSERARALRFHHAHDARWYVARHNALRLLLAAETQIPPHDLCFVEGAHGKPSLDINTPLHFNMSHSKGWALIGIGGDASVGVDIELSRSMTDWTALAERCLSSAEWADLVVLPPSQQPSAFLRCWTRKEACLKALGSGLTIEPDTFDAGIERDEREVSIDSGPTRHLFSVVSINLPTDALAAVAWMKPASIL